MLTTELGFPLIRATPLLCDNQAALVLAEDPSFHTRAKHINIKWHYSVGMAKPTCQNRHLEFAEYHFCFLTKTSAIEVLKKTCCSKNLIYQYL